MHLDLQAVGSRLSVPTPQATSCVVVVLARYRSRRQNYKESSSRAKQKYGFYLDAKEHPPINCNSRESSVISIYPTHLGHLGAMVI